VIAADCGRPQLSTTLDLSLVVNYTLTDDNNDDDDNADDMHSSYDEGRRRGADANPTNVVLVGAACGSGLVMFTAILTAVVFALRSQHRRRHHGTSADCCCCWCCCDGSDHGLSHSVLPARAIYQ